MAIAMYSQELGASKVLFLYKSKMTEKPYQVLPRCVAHVLQEALKYSWRDYKNTKYWHLWEWTKWLNGATALS